MELKNYSLIRGRSAKFIGAFAVLISTMTLSSAMLSSAVMASTLSGSLNSRGAFVFPSGNPNASSYDGPGRDTMSAFLPFTSSTLLQVSNFTGHAQGSKLEAFMLSEMACFDGHMAGLANNFGVVNQSNTFTSLINTQNVDPLAVGSLDQTASDNLTFALQSPEGLFYSVDSRNTDGGVAHMLALQVTTSGTVNLPNTNLSGGNGPLAFNLLAGDVILFIEDMKTSGNIASGMVPFASDFDYNDMVIVIRQSANEIPEPATCLLLGSALFGYRRRSVLVA